MSDETTGLARTLADWSEEFAAGQRTYFAHVRGLVLPGREVSVPNVDQVAPGPITEWDEAECALLVDEGRRQVDRQQTDLADIRGRAQWVFTVASAVTAALTGALFTAKADVAVTIIWVLALLLAAYGIAGAAAILTVRADFNVIHAAVMSRLDRPVIRSLAAAYARMMGVGENTVAARLTVLRQAVVFCILGSYLGAFVYLVH